VNIQPIIIIVIIHLILCVLIVIYSIVREAYLRKENILPTFFLPLIGPISAILIEWMNYSGRQGEYLEEIFLPPLEDDILWKTVKNYHESSDIVPLEEALLLNENQTKRRMMLNALYDDPLKYLDVLFVASHNEDVETAHYATTTISHSQRSFQLEIQKASVAVAENPDDIFYIDNYINLLEGYINSGLLDEYLLRNQRIIYSKALDRKLSIKPNDKLTLIRKLRNHLELNEFSEAARVSDQMKTQWFDDEDVWNEILRVCIEGRDKEKLRETIEAIRKAPIQWTKQGKEKIGLWIEGVR
jgi:hypothetical protein